jgi:hypothetical protein
MRAPIIMLVLANLAFAAWALLIDRPVDPPAARDISHLPKLVLVGDPVPGAVVASNAAKNAAGGPTAGGTPIPGHCVTVGPFGDLNTAAAASSLLKSRGFIPSQRDEPGEDLIAYWVYLDNVPSEAAATRLLQKLHSNGLADASVMPMTSTTEPRRISVGLFNEQAGADRRARQVKNMGLTPAITQQHQPQATYWVNINLATPEQSVSTEGLLPPAAEGAHLEIRDCPAAASSAPPPASSAPPAGAGHA